MKRAQDSAYTRMFFSSSKSQIVRSPTSQDLAGILEEESEPIRHPNDGKTKSCTSLRRIVKNMLELSRTY